MPRTIFHPEGNAPRCRRVSRRSHRVPETGPYIAKRFRCRRGFGPPPDTLASGPREDGVGSPRHVVERPNRLAIETRRTHLDPLRVTDRSNETAALSLDDRKAAMRMLLAA